MPHRVRVNGLAALIGLSLLSGVGIAQADAAENAVKPALQPFDLSQVTLGKGVLQTETDADRAYLHSLDSDSLLANFRRNAGLPAPGKPLGGWEAPDCELRGHFVGHYLSACALMYRSTGDSALKAKADALVAELARCQSALGGGYLSAFPESFFDRVEARENVWAPYYTIHKIMAGLVDMYTYCGNKQALDIAEAMADYFKRRTDKLTDDRFNAMLGTEFGGMANVLYDLYAINHRADDLALAHRFDQQSFLHPLSEDVDDLSNIHANTHIPKILGAARRYELLRDPSYGHLTTFFWDRIANHRSYATGGSNAHEGWGPPDKLAHTLLKGWGANQETCTTYNMLKVTRDLIRWTGDPKYADYYERAYWNGIVEAQNPATGMMIYYTPLAAGGVKQWGTPTDSFWCCYGTGVESFAKLGDSIYFHDGDGLYVNLYAASTVNWTEKRVSVEQKTNFPEEQASTLIVHARKPSRFALHLHVPLWTDGNSRITVNGKPEDVEAKPGTYAVLTRTWRDGDRVEISLPMALHTQAMPDDPNAQAVLYGPIVLAGIFDKTSPYTPYDRTTGLLKTDSADPAAWLKPVPGQSGHGTLASHGNQPLTFQTTGQAHETTFIPLYRVIDQPYTVYWTVDRPGSGVDTKIAAYEQDEQIRQARFLDSVHPNDPDSEKAHNLVADRSNSGVAEGHDWRDATGFFQWDLKVTPGAPAKLLVSYWGPDRDRTFDILVNGQQIATVTLTGGKPAGTYDVEYPIPAATVGDASQITVRFQAHSGSNAGGVFGCATEK